MQIILTPPLDLTPKTVTAFIPSLAETLETGMVSAILVQQGKNNNEDYQKIIKSIIAIAKPKNCATLVHNHISLVQKTGADGVHISSGHDDFLSALSELKPQFIVGIGNIVTRHQAMLAGEAGADYICFGDVDVTVSPNELDLVQWWSQLFQTPCLVFDQYANLNRITHKQEDFVGLTEGLWNEKHPGKALLSFKSPVKNQQASR